MFTRTKGIFLSASIEGILQLFTNFYLHRKFLIFLRNNRDCKAVDPYNASKRYAVIESLDLLRNIPLPVSVKQRNPIRNFLRNVVQCTGNHSVIANVCILTQFYIFILK